MNIKTKEINGVKVDDDLDLDDWSMDWGFIEKVDQGKVFFKEIRGKTRYLMVVCAGAGRYELAWLGNDDLDGWSLLGRSVYLREDGRWRELYARGKRQVGLWLQWNGWQPCHIRIQVEKL